MDRVTIRVAAEPVSVPAARQFVTDGLVAWGEHDLVDDVRLCVSELAANAALHAESAFMDVSLERLPDAVRVLVQDEGRAPLDDLRAQAHLNGQVGFMPERSVTTGRGLFLVEVLARAWGVISTDRGKLIWADVSNADSIDAPRPRVNPQLPPEEETPQMPAEWRLLWLQDCPVELSLRQDAHLDELIRELQLVDTDGASPSLVAVMSGLLATQAHARHTGRRAALQARAAGLDHVSIAMPALVSVADDVVALHNAVQEADRLCRDLELVTLAADPEVTRLREWMVETIVDQVRNGAEPIPWEDWRAAR